MTHLRCANCSSALTRECRRGALEEYGRGAIDRAPAVPHGVMVRLTGEHAAPAVQDGAAIGAEVRSRADAIAINPADALADGLRSVGNDTGCCGSDGLDGPNRACATCGAVVATEWSDCWTQAEVRFLTDAVVEAG